MEENNKKGKGSIIVIVLLILVILGLVGYICYDKEILFKHEVKEVESKNVKNINQKEEETVVTNYAVTDEKVYKLIDNLMNGRNCDDLENYANDKKVEVKDINNVKAYLIAEKNDLFNSLKESITLDEVNKVVAKYLGKDYKFDPTTIDYKGSWCPQYIYDSSTKTFNKQETACGWTCGPRTSYKLVKAVDTDGILQLDIKVIFASVAEGKDGMYSDYLKTNKIGSYEDQLESLYLKGSDYRFTFKLEDGNYVFVSSNPLN